MKKLLLAAGVLIALGAPARAQADPSPAYLVKTMLAFYDDATHISVHCAGTACLARFTLPPGAGMMGGPHSTAGAAYTQRCHTRTHMEGADVVEDMHDRYCVRVGPVHHRRS